MVNKPDLHLSERFRLRQLDKHVDVICVVDFDDILLDREDIEVLEPEYPSVYFVNIDPIWRQFISYYTCQLTDPIHLLYYRHQTLSVIGVYDFWFIRPMLDDTLRECDIN